MEYRSSLAPHVGEGLRGVAPVSCAGCGSSITPGCTAHGARHGGTDGPTLHLSLPGDGGSRIRSRRPRKPSLMSPRRYRTSPAALCVGKADREGLRDRPLALSPVWIRDEAHRGHHRPPCGTQDSAPLGQDRKGAAATRSERAELNPTAPMSRALPPSLSYSVWIPSYVPSETGFPHSAPRVGFASCTMDGCVFQGPATDRDSSTVMLTAALQPSQPPCSPRHPTYRTAFWELICLSLKTAYGWWLGPTVCRSFPVEQPLRPCSAGSASSGDWLSACTSGRSENVRVSLG
jgi:hypothetical protein